MRQRFPHRFQPQHPFGLLLGAWSLLGGLPQAAIAQFETTVFFQPPPMSSPGNREAGGQRSDSCTDTQDAKGLVAIVPNTNVGLTTRANPDLFVYVPVNSADRAELRIFEEATGAEVFVGQVSLPESSPGSDYTYESAIVHIPLAAGPVTLEPSKNYLWALMLVCNSESRDEDIVVDVVVQHVGDEYLDTLTPGVTDQLNQADAASTEERLAAYSAAGVWQDLLSELAVLTQAEPDRYATAWTDLLTSQGLAAIASAPIYHSTLQPLASGQR